MRPPRAHRSRNRPPVRLAVEPLEPKRLMATTPWLTPAYVAACRQPFSAGLSPASDPENTGVLNGPHAQVVGHSFPGSWVLAGLVGVGPVGLTQADALGNYRFVIDVKPGRSVFVVQELRAGLPPLTEAFAAVLPAPPPPVTKPPVTPPVTPPAAPYGAPIHATVAVGGSLDLRLPAATPGGRATSFLITPQPLPAHMTFDSGTGELTFAPAPGQAGEYDFTVKVTAGGHTYKLPVAVTATATTLPATRVSGQVVDAAGKPVAGVPVVLGGLTAETDRAGRFTLSGVPAAPGPLAVDGPHGPGGKYMMLMAPTAQFLGHPLYAGYENTVAAPIVLPAVDLAHATDFSRVDAGKTQVLTSPLLAGVSLTVAPHSAMTADGKPFTGKIALTLLDEGQVAEILAPGVRPGAQFIGVDGPELMFATPAKITLPNLQHYAPGSVLELLTMDMTTGGFDVTGHLGVSADGKWLVTTDGGVLGSSCLNAVDNQSGQGTPVTMCGGGGGATAAGSTSPANGGLGPTTGLQTVGGSSGSGGGGGGLDLNAPLLASDVSVVTGEYLQDHSSVAYQSQGQAVGLDLQYSSLQADPRPVVQFEPSTQIASNSGQVTSVSVQTTVGGVSNTPITYNVNSTGNPTLSDGQQYRVSAQVDGTALATGAYTYTMAVTQNFGSTGPQLSASYSGYVNVVNNAASPYGAGWSVGGLQHLVTGGADGSVLVTDGSAGAEQFLSAPAGPVNDVAVISPSYSGGQLNVLGNDTMGGLAAAGGTTSGVSPWVFVAGDYNGDGKADLAVASSATVKILLGNGSGGFTSGSTYTLSSNVAAIVTGHFHSGTPSVVDLATLGTDGTISVLAGNGNGTFATPVTTSLGVSAGQLAAGDFNGDGLTDLAVAGCSDGKLRTLLYTSGGSFGTPTAYTMPDSGASAVNVAAGDLTGDGKVDLAVVSNPTYKLVMFVGNGSGGFTAGGSYSVAPRSITLGNESVGAFQGGLGEVAVYSPDAQSLMLFPGTSSGTWANPTYYPLAVGTANSAQIATGDLNGDGKPDIIVAPTSNTSISVLESNPLANQLESLYTVSVPNPVSGPLYVAAGPLLGHSWSARFVSPMGDPSTLTQNSGGTWTRAYPDGTAVQFNASGQETSATDRNGNAFTYTYVTSGAAAGALATVTDPVGRVTSLAYDTSGHLHTVTDPAGRVTTYTVDTAGNLTQVTDPDGALTQYAYSTPSNHRITGETSPNGQTATVTYDSFGRFQSESLYGGTGTTSVAAAQEKGLLAAGGSGPLPSPASYQGSVTDPDGHTTTLALDAMSDVATLTDANGKTTTYTRDMNGRPVAVTDPIGRTVSYTYDMKGDVTSVTRPDATSLAVTYDPTFAQPTSVTDYRGLVTTLTLDSHGNVTRRTDPDTGHEDFTYNSAGQVLTDTDRNGHTVSFAYDSYGRLATVTYPGTGTPTTHYGYDSAGDVTTATDELGHAVTFTYDLAGRVLSSQDPVQAAAGKATSYTYDSDGNRTSVTDALGHVMSYTYDARDRLASTTDPVNQGTSHRTTYGYDARGNLTSVTDPNGLATSYTFDSDNRVKTVTDAAGGVTSYTYDDAGQLTAVTDPDNHTVTYGYDTDGRLATETVPGPATYTYSYDNDNNLTAVTDPLTHAVSYTFDSLNRLTSSTVTVRVMVYPGFYTNSPLTTTYSYDAAGNETAVTDPLGHVVSYGYDARNRLVTETQPSGGGTTTYAYDAASRLVSLTDPVGNVTSYGYDSADRVTAETDPRGKVTTYNYDLVGNLTSKVDRDGRETDYAYDADNRLTGENWVGSSPSERVTYTYDNGGRLTLVQDANSKYAYTYDNANRLLTVNDNGTTGLPQVTLTYGYDGAGNRTSLDDSLGGLASYTYDSRNELTQLTQSGTGVASKRVNFAYDSAGRMTTLTRYSDLAGTTLVAGTAFTYDTADRLTGITHSNSGSSTIASYAYTLDAASRLTSESRTWAGGASSDTVTYSYTNNGQVTGVTHSNGSFANESFSYDANGNRTMTGYTTGAANELTADGVYTYAYDDEGNLTSRTKVSDGSKTLYKWDYRDRLTEVDSVVGGVTMTLATYTYDALDRRIGVAEGGSTTWTLYDGTAPILDFNGSGTQTARYLQAGAVDAILARETSGGTVAWYLEDRLGTVRDLVNNSGTVIDHVDYGVFGNVAAESSPANGDGFKYAGMRYDATTGLNFAVHRIEDGLTGRWLSQDPAKFMGRDDNLYRYAYDAPSNLNDPLGLQVPMGQKPRLTTGVSGSLHPLDDVGKLKMYPVPTEVNPAWLSDPSCVKLRQALDEVETSIEVRIEELDPDTPSYYDHVTRIEEEEDYRDKLRAAHDACQRQKWGGTYLYPGSPQGPSMRARTQTDNQRDELMAWSARNRGLQMLDWLGLTTGTTSPAFKGNTPTYRPTGPTVPSPHFPIRTPVRTLVTR